MGESIDNMTAALEQALAAARRGGAAGARATFHRSESIACQFEAGTLKHAGQGEGIGFAIDVLVNGRIGTVRGNRMEDIGRLVGDALILARVGQEAHFDAWPAPGTVTRVPAYSEATVALSRDDLLAPCRTIVEAMRAFNPELRIDAGAERGMAEGVLLTSGGVEHRWRSSTWSLGGWVQRTQGTNILFSGEGRAWRDRNAFFAPGPIVERMQRELRWAERMAPAPSGPVPVLAPPHVLQSFLAPLRMGINGRTVAKGESPLRDRLGQRVLAPCFTIVEEPHEPYAPGAREMDDDGIPTRRRALVEQGVLKTFLYDLDSAGMAGAEPTGSPGNAPCNPHVLPGTRPHADLLAGIPDGLLIVQLIGYGQSNIINGDFSCNVGLGYRVERGEVVGRVKDCMIAGNLHELLASPEVELSSDLDYRGAFPWLLLPGVRASARA